MIGDETRGVVEAALGCVPAAGCGADESKLELEFKLAEELEPLGATPVPARDQRSITAQILAAYSWSCRHFPMCIRDSAGEWGAAVQTVAVGVSADEGEYVSASSPARPRVVFLAARWPLRSPYRVGSLLAHEMMHQALYLREHAETPVRPSSLGYSPWRRELRPGRLVWHAFWTFSTQFVGLAEATLAGADDILGEDPEITSFLAEMQVRIELCAQSLQEFELPSAPEAARIERGLAIVGGVGGRLERVEGYIGSRRTWMGVAEQEVQSWSALTALGPRAC